MQNTKRTLWSFVAAAVLTFGLASSSHEFVTVSTHTGEAHGTYLVDGDGASLYVFANDTQGEASACTGDCAQAWPPLVVDGAIAFGDEVSLDLLGTVERDDGDRQVTYDGWPLYYFANDEEPGDALGHGVGDAWFLIRADGEVVEATGDENGEENGDGSEGDAAAVDPEVMEAGQSVFRNICAECHGDAGGGGLGPRLVDREALTDTSRVARRLIRGAGYMPAFGNRLSDDELANVMTFVRNSWGNDFGVVTPEEVSEVR